MDVGHESDVEPVLERWTLRDPELGVIEVVVGEEDALRALDPGWPEAKALSTDEVEKDRELDQKVALARENSSSVRGIVADRVHAWSTSSNRGLLVRIGGTVAARLEKVRSVRVALDATAEEGKYTTPMTASGERLQLTGSSLFGEIHDVYLHRKVDGRDEVVALDPPVGSRGARRREEMDASPWKRVAYPFAAGMGKAGWAITVLVLGPLVARLVAWLLSFLPDVEIPWPHIDLPRIPWPDITLPRIPWPDVTAPGWVLFVLDYTKIWVPILVGLVLGVLALRKQKKARRSTDVER